GTIGGGSYNSVTGPDATVAGGRGNVAGGIGDTVGGGSSNQANSGDYSIIGGGSGNLIELGAGATISGGWANKIRTNAFLGTIGGGINNEIRTNACYATIGGGNNNAIHGNAWYTTISGGYENTIAEDANWAMIPGGRDNTVGRNAEFAFAAGRHAKAMHEGAFVWADSTDADFTSTANNQFLVRASGGVGIRTNAPQAQLDVVQPSSGALAFRAYNAGSGNYAHMGGNWYGVYGYGSSWDFYAGGTNQHYGSASSRRWKANVQPIAKPLAKLARLRGVSFDWDAAHGGRHDVGMIAEEVGEVLPEIVAYETNGVDALGMDYSRLTPLLVEAIKAVQRQADARQRQLERKLQKQQNQIAGLEQRLKQIQLLLKRSPAE
ncbi:MAG: tail fiber domain-containing protein, partial [Anaerolineae bacterium]